MVGSVCTAVSFVPIFLHLFITSTRCTTSPKRGLIDVATSYGSTDDKIWTEPGSDLTWYYNYDDSPSPGYSDTSLQFVPMLFAAPNTTGDTSFLDTVQQQLDGGANVTAILTFNEPDGTSATGGSAVDPTLAAQTWIKEVEPLKKHNISLGGPAVTGSESGFTWLQSFFTACAGNCSVDFLPVHWYGNFEGLASHIGQVRGTYPNMSIWVTEYALPNASLTDSQSFYNSSADYFDRIEWVSTVARRYPLFHPFVHQGHGTEQLTRHNPSYINRYSYFGSFRSSASNVGPNAAMLTQNGKLTDIGAYYLGVPPQGNVPAAAAGLSAGRPLKWRKLGAVVAGVVCLSGLMLF
ncbi:MAG: hypothetical protein M1838_004295 [Thelocarpon superellum]|nr:MAG: hypothetical protein M1838_004295 [Thelocarpon superellum]